MFAQLFLALAVMGFNPPSAAPCPVVPSDSGLVWQEVTPVTEPPLRVDTTASLIRTQSMGEALAAMHNVHARPGTRQEMIDHVCALWAEFRGLHVVALNSYAIRRARDGMPEVVVQAINAEGVLVLERRDTVWPPNTRFILVYGPTRAFPIRRLFFT